MLTGRAVHRKKNVVENVRKLDILTLQRAKLFQQGPETKHKIAWQNGDRTVYTILFSLVYSGDTPSSMCLEYAISDQSEESMECLFYHIEVVSTLCHYGGKRWWYICPLSKSGRICGRRCRILYLPQGASYFGCRECYNLTYESRQKHRSRLHSGYEDLTKFINSMQALLNGE